MTIAIAVILFVASALSVEGSRHLAEQPSIAPFVRLFSVTQWNSSANLTDLAAYEVQGSVLCGATTVSVGFVGINANVSVSPVWGSFVKVFDFANTSAYVTYQSCSDTAPTRAITKPWETGKFYAQFQIDAEKVGDLRGSPITHVSLSNSSNTSATIALRGQLFDELMGMTRSTDVGADSGFITSVFPTKNILNSAIDLAFKNLQGVDAYYYYKHGYGAIPTLPLYTAIKAVQTSSSYEIEFVPARII